MDWRDAHGAIHGDRVMAEVSGEGWDGRLKARCVKVKARGEMPLPGTCRSSPGAGAWSPLNRAFRRSSPFRPRIWPRMVSS